MDWKEKEGPPSPPTSAEDWLKSGLEAETSRVNRVVRAALAKEPARAVRSPIRRNVALPALGFVLLAGLFISALVLQYRNPVSPVPPRAGGRPLITNQAGKVQLVLPEKGSQGRVSYS